MQNQDDIEFGIRRSRLSIIASILEFADGERKETRVMYHSGCNHKQFTGYEESLFSCGLLKRSNGTIEKTEKGDLYLEGFKEMMSSLKNGDSSVPKQPSYTKNGNGYTINKVSD